MTGQGTRRRWRTGTAFHLGVALSLIMATPAPALATCPDAATAHAARLIEFQTMMMDVGLRCSRVGVPLVDHLDTMAAKHRTIFENARNRVRSFMDMLASSMGASGGTTGAKTPPVARSARHGDPLDRYMTMLGNRYGAGSTSPDRCHAFDAIALSLADTINNDKLLTMVAESLIGLTLLETLTGCPAKP